MKRRAWATAVTIGMAGLASAADPLPLPTPGEVITLKTAGQPERKVRVLKAERTADGTVLTDVKDLTSGLVYTLTDARGAAGKPSAPAAPAKPTTPTLSGTPTPAPATTKPAGPTVPGAGYSPPAARFPSLTHQSWGSKLPGPLFGGATKPATPPAPAGKPVSVTPPPVQRTTYAVGPQVKSRETDPLLAAVAGRRTEPVPAPAKPPTLFGRLFGWGKPEPAPRVNAGAVAAQQTYRPAPVTVLASAQSGGAIRLPLYSTTLPAPSAQQQAAARTQQMIDDGPILATAPPRRPARPAPVPAALAAPRPVPPAAESVAVLPPPVLPKPDAPPAPAAPSLSEPVLTIAPPLLLPAAGPTPAAPTTVAVAPPTFDPAGPILPPPAPVPPKPETPVPEAPKVEMPKPEMPKPEMPRVEVAKVEPPVVVAVAEPKIELPPVPDTPRRVELPPAVEPAKPATPLAPLPPADPAIAVATAAPPAAPPRVVSAPLPEPVPLPAPEAKPTASPDEQMRAELTETVQTLRSHARPRTRLEAASALANGRYASRVEVQAVILEAARTDGNPVVRGHCVKLLAQLGVTDPSYQEDLMKWANDREPAVSRAASDALQKLASAK